MECDLIYLLFYFPILSWSFHNQLFISVKDVRKILVTEDLFKKEEKNRNFLHDDHNKGDIFILFLYL